MQDKDNLLQLINFDDAKDKIVFQFINTEQNKAMLANMPHRDFKDLSIIYRLVCEVDENGLGSLLIHNNLAEILGFTEVQMFKFATENTKRLLPPTTENILETMKKFL
jgi:hypothetical protein